MQKPERKRERERQTDTETEGGRDRDREKNRETETGDMLLTPDTGLIGGGGLKTQGQNAAKQLLAKHLCKETFLISMQPLVSKMVILFIILALLHLQCLCSFLF